ncbi:TPA: restriction endonuclease subunit S [Enterococcus faecalis]|uniref:restriction endonuclease subunit S n=1 Tax=Enterococcus TaxID=1350 RepID=UPI0013DFA5EE|nr:MULTISPECIES: restriction endonuclease subunit S [Enterococcus]EME7189005.1 restriction endonuclease subunit S [Enterococcus faecium]MBD9903514.1 restriction endonuclease subunit S [Enterococcus faecium]MDG4587951.1 restriction endonuclease subunit S [Enterococcus faecium]MDT2060827.1 restriction endonuclease subunit S [Enterococcus faecalis]MDT2351192.1 restriction endonuclease subunit S [Enterococcus faecium]
MSNDTQPEIRFPGFTDDWEQRKLGDETKILAGGDVDKTKLKENGKYPVLANALTNDGIVGYYDDDFRIKAPAVTVTGRGDVGYAQARRVNFTPVVRLLSVKSKHDVDFLENSINNHKVLVESTGVPQLTAPQLGNYKIFFPTIEEETKIGSLFKKLDTAINIHQRELDLLKETKKGFLQKMFPKNGAKVPEIRFPGFTEDWEQRKLGDIFKKDIQKNKDLEFNSDSVISVAKMKLSTPSAKSSDEYMKTYNKIWKGNIAFEGHTNDEFPNGRFVLNDCQDGIVSHIYDVYSAVDEYDNEFMKRYINNPYVMRKILINATSSARMMKSLNSVEFLKQSILLPILSEQQKIGGFFYQLDNIIALHQRKLDLLKETKKGFLQKMFV